MTNTTNTVRVTKAQKYQAAIALLEGKPVITISGKDDKAGVVLDAEYLCDFFRGEMALLARKNSGDSKKPTKAQQENEAYKAKILEFLYTQEGGVTATDVMNACGLSSNQKAAALLNSLKDSGEVVKVIEKGKSLFSLAVEGE